MRLPIATVVIAVLIPVAGACGPGGDPAPAASAAQGGRKDELCLAYRQSQADVAAVVLEVVDAVTAAEVDLSGIEEAKRRLAAALDKQKATLEAEIVTGGDAQTVAAIRDYVKTAEDRKLELQAAGGEPDRVAQAVLADKGKVEADRVLELCAERGLPPKP